MIQVGIDPSWVDYGYDAYLNRSLQPSDPNYVTSEQFDANTQDTTLKSGKVSGRFYVKTMIVNDDVNDRVLIGYQPGGF